MPITSGQLQTPQEGRGRSFTIRTTLASLPPSGREEFRSPQATAWQHPSQ